MIARRGGNQASHFLEAAAFGMGDQKGFIVIPVGRRGCDWLKFSDELRKARVSLFAKAGCESGSSLASVKTVGKEEEVRPGLAPLWKGPSFVEVLRSGSVSTMKKEPIGGGVVILGGGRRRRSNVLLTFFRW